MKRSATMHQSAHSTYQYLLLQAELPDLYERMGSLPARLIIPRVKQLRLNYLCFIVKIMLPCVILIERGLYISQLDEDCVKLSLILSSRYFINFTD